MGAKSAFKARRFPPHCLVNVLIWQTSLEKKKNQSPSTNIKISLLIDSSQNKRFVNRLAKFKYQR